ncbi:MAG: hypothetical protein A3B29_00525 [Candidatus Sungbacteria bacterium RIFCSPLOWO2_01_FULL_51_34]|nr:MAG: hypothetical protein A3B29_00525 [Candidatus Sungbacteria bacterium RIFCSPLOWO2_01_FULL_51_34]
MWKHPLATVILTLGFVLFFVTTVIYFTLPLILPPSQNTSAIDIPTVHSQYIAIDHIPFSHGSSDTFLFLTAPTQADTKNNHWPLRAGIWKCMGLTEKDVLSQNLRRGVVYKATYQILGYEFTGERGEQHYIKMRCFNFEEIGRTPQKEP